MKFCCHFVAESNMELQIIELLLSFFAVEYHSHSLRLNALCVIYVCLIPSGDSDSLRHSYSTACTASGYRFVIRVITRETVLL